ncbi:MAG: phage minor head protein [Smithella sp.]
MASRQEQIKRLLELADKLEPKVSASFLASIENIKSSITLKQIERLLIDGNYSQVIDLINFELVNNQAAPLKDALTSATIDGGLLTASMIKPFTNSQGVQVVVRFNVVNPQLAQKVNDYQYRLIKAITDEQRATIKSVLAENLNLGINPLNTARDIRDSIGLTQYQNKAVLNFRRMLETKPSEALNRALRDKRFDRTIINSAAKNKDLTTEQIDKMVERYRQKYLKYRAETIARTESIRALSESNKAVYDQMVEQGQVSESEIKRFWHYAADSKTRDWHRTIPRLNPEGVGLNEPFKTERGPLLYPCDPNGSASNTINCRCVVFTRII